MYLNENVLNSNFELPHTSEIRQILVIQKLKINFKAQKLVQLIQYKTMVNLE